MLDESHNSLCYNGTTRLYQFLKRQYYWKGLKESVQNFSYIVHNVKQPIYKHQIMCNFYLKILQSLMDFLSIDLTDPFETTTKGNQYALTVICMFTNYIICIFIPDKSADKVLKTYLKKYILDFEEAKRFCQIMEVNLKIHYFQK